MFLVMSLNLDLKLIENSLSSYRPKRKFLRHLAKRSSVAIILRQKKENHEVLMIKRADREGDPWSGHMAFPGGRRESRDKDSYATAVRETNEEVGIVLPECARYIGRLSDKHARPIKYDLGMFVTPFVFMLESKTDFKLNHEVASLVWIPLDFFSNAENQEEMFWQYRSRNIAVPCYKYEGFTIWGLSLSMLIELTEVISYQK